MLGLTGSDSPNPIWWGDWLTDPLILPLCFAFSLMLTVELRHHRQQHTRIHHTTPRPPLAPPSLRPVPLSDSAHPGRQRH